MAQPVRSHDLDVCLVQIWTEVVRNVDPATEPGQLAAEVHPPLGHRWRLGGHPLTIDDVRGQIYSQSATMSGLDLIDTSDRGAWSACPSARSLLPGTDVLAEYFASE